MYVSMFMKRIIADDETGVSEFAIETKQQSLVLYFDEDPKLK